MLGRLAASNGRRLVISELNDEVSKSLLRAGMEFKELPRSPAMVNWSKCGGLFVAEHYNIALKICEDVLLSVTSSEALPSTPASASKGTKALELLREITDEYISDDDESLRHLLGYFELVEYQPGEVL